MIKVNHTCVTQHHSHAPLRPWKEIEDAVACEANDEEEMSPVCLLLRAYHQRRNPMTAIRAWSNEEGP